MIKLNTGFSRKVGEAHYGSRGASVNLELEVESSMIEKPEKIHQRLHYLFDLAREAVEEELQSQSNTPAKPPASPSSTPAAEAPVCSECGDDRVTDKVVRYSTEKFGRVLCYACQKQLQGKG
jgi:hypothetical protein